jgi:predicted acetyltransferase
MPIEVRGIEPAEAEHFLSALTTPFAFDTDDDPKALERFSLLFESDRARCAFDGDSIVGTLGVFSLDMTVPGGRVPCAGTTQVTVQPTHRRRGVLRSMIQSHFEEARLRNDPIAALWASDSGIYHRFGYGMASVYAEARIPRGHTKLHRRAPDMLPVRLVDAADVLEVIRPVFDRMVAIRPGSFNRTEEWWARRLRDIPSDREGATAYRYAVADGPGGPEGYVQYRLKSGDWSSHHGDGEVQVREIIAETPAASASLWTYLMGHDLVTTITTGLLPEDDPLFSILDATRRGAPTVFDQIWLRILDLPAALEARAFSAEGTLVIEATDPMDGSTSRHRLTVDGGVGTCGPTSDPVDIHLDIEDLGASYLGRPRFRQLARAGRLTGSPESLTLADRMFAWDPAPWCQEIF